MANDKCFGFNNPDSIPTLPVLFGRKENKEHIDRKEFYILSFVFFVAKCIQSKVEMNLFLVRLPLGLATDSMIQVSVSTTK